MWNQLSEFAQHHLWAVGILVSSLWFIAGKQYLSKGQYTTGISWQAIGALILLIACGWATKEKQWMGFIFGLAVLYFEVHSIRRTVTRREKRK